MNSHKASISHKNQEREKSANTRKLIPLLALLIGTGASLTSAQTNSDSNYSVVTQNDLYEYVAGTVTRIDWPGGSRTLVTGSNAQTDVFPIPESVPLAISVAERRGQDGVTLGMTFPGVSGTLDPGGDSVWKTRSVYQPIALNTFIDAQQGVITSGHHDRWMFTDDTFGRGPATFSFDAKVAILLNPEDVQAFSDFYHLGLPSTHQLGILIRSRRVDLGPNGLGLVVTTEGHGFTADPDVTTYYLPRADSLHQTSTLTGQVTIGDDEQTLIHLEGVMGRGDNLILLSHGGGASIGPIRIIPIPTIAYSDQAAQEASVGKLAMLSPREANESDAQPLMMSAASVAPPPILEAAPDGPETCVLPSDDWPGVGPWDLTITTMPESDEDCPDPIIWSSSKKVVTILVAGPFCGPPNGTHVSQTVEVAAGSVSIAVQGATVTGSYEESNSLTDGYTYGPGEDCGECLYQFKHRFLKTWRITTYMDFLEWFCHPSTENYIAKWESGIIQTTCDIDCPE